MNTKKIVKQIIEALDAHPAFEEWFHDIKPELQREIMEEIEQIIDDAQATEEGKATS